MLVHVQALRKYIIVVIADKYTGHDICLIYMGAINCDKLNNAPTKLHCIYTAITQSFSLLCHSLIYIIHVYLNSQYAMKFFC